MKDRFRRLLLRYAVFFFKQKTAYEIRPCDWSSDVCSSDLEGRLHLSEGVRGAPRHDRARGRHECDGLGKRRSSVRAWEARAAAAALPRSPRPALVCRPDDPCPTLARPPSPNGSQGSPPLPPTCRGVGTATRGRCSACSIRRCGAVPSTIPSSCCDGSMPRGSPCAHRTPRSSSC